MRTRFTELFAELERADQPFETTERSEVSPAPEPASAPLFAGLTVPADPSPVVYILKGEYEVEVVRCLTVRSRKLRDLIVIEMKILVSDNPVRPPGLTCARVIDLSKDRALSEVRDFLVACGQQVDGTSFAKCVSPENPLAGRRVRLWVREVQNRSGLTFLKSSWSEASR